MLRLSFLCSTVLACVAVLSEALAVQAVAIRVPAIPELTARANAVVVGKVTGIEDQNVTAPALFGPTKAYYQVAMVKVDEALVGAKGDKTVRVAFIPSAPGGVRRPGGVRPVILEKDMEGCFFLTKHPTEDFYVLANAFDYLKKDATGYTAQLDLARQAAKLLADPEKGLKSDNPTERWRTAALLLIHYRSPRFSDAKTEPIPAEQSKRILTILAEANWTPPVPGPGTKPENDWRLNPVALFYQLQLGPKDGWTPPQDFREFNDKAKQWLKEHADTYRIERFTSERAGKE